MTNNCSSSNSTGRFLPAPDWAGVAWAMACALSAACCERRTGGKRTMSPACTRVAASARPLLTRTSPLRMMR